MDRISVSFPVESFDRHISSWDRVTTMRGGKVSYSVLLPLGEGLPSVFVGVTETERGQHPYGKVELNPARVVDPLGWKLAPVDSVRATVVDAVAKGLDVLSPRVPSVDEMNVKRLDVARDFQTEHSEFYVRGLAPVHRPWSKKNLVHYDPARKGAQTLMVGSGAGVVRLYDKTAETGGKAPPGTLRWEAECRSEWSAKYGDITTFGKVNAETVTKLAANRWEWSAMGTNVGAADRVVERALRSGMSSQQILTFLGYVQALSSGVATSVTSKNSATKYRRMARDLGVSIDELEGSSAQFFGRLDWESGTEKLHAA